jgi:hypothetical protein
MAELDARRQKPKDEFVAARAALAGVLRSVQLSSVPWQRRILPPTIKELTYVAIDASTTPL